MKSSSSSRTFVALLLCSGIAAATLLAAPHADAQSSSRDRDRGRSSDRDRSGDRSRGTSSANSSTQPSAVPATFDQKYAVLVEKNIFLRNRTRPQPRGSYTPPVMTTRPSEPTQGPPPRRPEEAFVLTGIALQEGRHVAFVENTDKGVTDRLVPGAAIASGKITAVERDHLDYEANGQTSRVDIGHNFAGALTELSPGSSGTTTVVTGTPAATSGATPTQPAGATAAPGAPPAPTDNSTAAIIERMRLRRLAEQQKK